VTGLGERGLGCPLLVISDGAPGLIGAVDRTMGAALRQRCLIHRVRKVLSKASKNDQVEVKADYWAIYEVPEDMDARSLTCRNALTPSPPADARPTRARCAPCWPSASH
jgi:transposase-like protein